MYTRDHGKEWIKRLTPAGRRFYKRAWIKTRRKEDKREARQ